MSFLSKLMSFMMLDKCTESLGCWQVTIESKGLKRWSNLSERLVLIGERSQGSLNYVYRSLTETSALVNCS